MIIDVQKYNLIREALADSTTASDQVDMISVPPKQFALKKIHDERVIEAATEILEDERVMTGITPMDTIQTFDEDPPSELILYVLVCYAVCVQRKWIYYSSILNKYIANKNNQEVVEYVQDIHHKRLDS